VIFPEILVPIFVIKEWQYKNRQILCKLFLKEFWGSSLGIVSRVTNGLVRCGFCRSDGDIS